MLEAEEFIGASSDIFSRNRAPLSLEITFNFKEEPTNQTNRLLPQGEYSHKVVKLNLSRAFPVNSFKLELGGGPGRAVGGHTEVGLEAEVKLAGSVLGQNAEGRKSRLEADNIEFEQALRRFL